MDMDFSWIKNEPGVTFTPTIATTKTEVLTSLPAGTSGDFISDANLTRLGPSSAIPGSHKGDRRQTTDDDDEEDESKWNPFSAVRVKTEAKAEKAKTSTKDDCDLVEKTYFILVKITKLFPAEPNDFLVDSAKRLAASHDYPKAFERFVSRTIDRFPTPRGAERGRGRSPSSTTSSSRSRDRKRRPRSSGHRRRSRSRSPLRHEPSVSSSGLGMSCDILTSPPPTSAATASDTSSSQLGGSQAGPLVPKKEARAEDPMPAEVEEARAGMSHSVTSAASSAAGISQMKCRQEMSAVTEKEVRSSEPPPLIEEEPRAGPSRAPAAAEEIDVNFLLSLVPESYYLVEGLSKEQSMKQKFADWGNRPEIIYQWVESVCDDAEREGRRQDVAAATGENDDEVVERPQQQQPASEDEDEMQTDDCCKPKTEDLEDDSEDDDERAPCDKEATSEEEEEVLAIRYCYRCGVAFDKLIGCNSVKCTVCGANNCYVCGQRVKSIREHFYGTRRSGRNAQRRQQQEDQKPDLPVAGSSSQTCPMWGKPGEISVKKEEEEEEEEELMVSLARVDEDPTARDLVQPEDEQEEDEDRGGHV